MPTQGGASITTIAPRCQLGTTYTDVHLIALVDHVNMLRESVRLVKTAHPFIIDAMVIMPDHLHTLWTLPEGDSDFSTRWGLIKSGFSRQLEVTERISPSRQTKGERGVCQRRFLRHAQDKFGSI